MPCCPLAHWPSRCGSVSRHGRKTEIQDTVFLLRFYCILICVAFVLYLYQVKLCGKKSTTSLAWLRPCLMIISRVTNNFNQSSPKLHNNAYYCYQAKSIAQNSLRRFNQTEEIRFDVLICICIGPKGSSNEHYSSSIWASPIWGGSNPLSGWFGAHFYY